MFIIRWVEKHKNSNNKIHWKDLIFEMKKRFGKLRSENKIKNFWYPKQLKRKSHKSEENGTTTSIKLIEQTEYQNEVNNNLSSEYDYTMSSVLHSEMDLLLMQYLCLA